MNRLAPALATLLFLALSPVSASAATVSAERTPNYRASDGTLVSFGAAPGESNRTLVTLSGSEVTFDDPAAELTAGAGCHGGGQRVVCPVVGATEVSVSLGDGHDEGAVRGRLDRASSHVRLDGGDGGDLLSSVEAGAVVISTLEGRQGDDRLVAGPVTRLDGGDDSDLLEGSESGTSFEPGPGRDRAVGRGGPDSFHLADDEDADDVDGGGGEDTAYFIGSDEFPEPRVVDLARRSGPYGDTLGSIEAVVGDEAGDDLRGGPAAERLEGRAGDDLLKGAGGDDVLIGSVGRDRLRGGEGDDLIRPGDEIVDRRASDAVACGPGSDTVADPSPRGPLPLDCETVSLTDGIELPVRPLLGGVSAKWPVRCLVAGLGPCAMTISLRAGDRVVGAARLRIGGGEARMLRVRLTGAGLRLASRGGVLGVRARIARSEGVVKADHAVVLPAAARR